MSRIFLSHASEDGRQARALKQWLSEQDPPLATEIFLDTDRHTGIPIGTRWQDELKRASGRCEAVICLLSRYWENSVECRVEYRTAENLGKQIFPARLEPEPEGGSSITGEWQRCDLFGDGHQTLVDLRDGEQPVAFLTDGLTAAARRDPRCGHQRRILRLATPRRAAPRPLSRVGPLRGGRRWGVLRS